MFLIFSSPMHEVQGELLGSHFVRRASSTFTLVNTLEAIFCIQSPWKFVRTFGSMKGRTSSKLGHVRSKTRSLGQI